MNGANLPPLSATGAGKNSMRRNAWILARVCLVGFGILVLTAALAGFAVPDVVHSGDEVRKPWGVEAMIEGGGLGYGLLLILGPHTLASSRATTLTLVGVTLAYCAGIFIVGLGRGSILHAAFGVVARTWPAAIAVAMVVAESRYLNTARQPASAGAAVAAQRPRR